MRQLFIPYLIFKNSLETANYYKEIFDGEITYIMKGKDMPNAPEVDKDKVMHLEITIQENLIYMADGDLEPNKQSMILLNYDNLDLMKTAYFKMAEEASVVRPMEDTFWGAIYGVLDDKYGMRWEFHFTKEKE